MLCPSRNRPEKAQELMAEWAKFSDFTRLIVIQDMDDTSAYPAGSEEDRTTLLIADNTYGLGAIGRQLHGWPAIATAHVNFFQIDLDDRVADYTRPPGIGPLVNAVAAELCADPGLEYIGFLGDDHRPRTPHWDSILVSRIENQGTGGFRGVGVAYGDDGLQHGNLPTSCIMSADLVRWGGFFNPPGCTHLYLDNFWKLLGQSVHGLHYVPEVEIEHLHPYAGKAEWDEGHKRVNSDSMNEHDGIAFTRFVNDDWPKVHGKILAGLRKQRESL